MKRMRKAKPRLPKEAIEKLGTGGPQTTRKGKRGYNRQLFKKLNKTDFE